MNIDYSAECWRMLDRWCAEHDPDEELYEGIFEAIEAYSAWGAKNSLEKYRDANQPGSTPTSHEGKST